MTKKHILFILPLIMFCSHLSGMDNSNLYLALKFGDLDFVKKMVEQKNNLFIKKLLLDTQEQIPGIRKINPLYIAAKNNKYEIVTYLLQKKCDPNALTCINKAGGNRVSFYAPLYGACARMNLDLIRLLIENGADPHEGKTEYMPTGQINGPQYVLSKQLSPLKKLKIIEKNIGKHNVKKKCYCFYCAHLPDCKKCIDFLEKVISGNQRNTRQYR